MMGIGNDDTLDKRLAASGVAPEIIAEARQSALESGGGIVESLLQKKAFPENIILEALGTEFGIPFWKKLPVDHIETGFTVHFPIQQLKKQKVVPLLNTPAGAVVAVNDPYNFQVVDDICHVLNLPERSVVLATQEEIIMAINLAYDLSRSTAKEFFEEISGESTDSLISEIEETGDLLDETSDAPIIKLLNLLLTGAVKDRASDIHIEPYQGNVKVR